MQVFVCYAIMLFASTAALELSELSVDDTQMLLKEWGLHDYLGRDFKKLSYDGRIMEVLDIFDFEKDRAQFPDATVAHWKKLLREVNLKRVGHVSNRRLSTISTDTFSGVKITKDKAIISLGTKGDVKLFRTGPGVLAVAAKSVNFDQISVTKILLNGKDLASLLPKPDQCAKNNGGCHIARNCVNKGDGRICGPCPAGWDSDGDTGCKPSKGRSAVLNSRLDSLPSKYLTQTSTSSCDVNGMSNLVKRFPPTGVQFAKVSRTKFKYTWTISGQSYGNGKYVAEASYVYGVGTGDEWPASGAFDHQRAESSQKNGWHTSGGMHWLTLELPERIRLDYYTVSSRYGCTCSKSQSPSKWDLYCIDTGKKVRLDGQSGQSFDKNMCRIYPAKTPIGGIMCQKFQWDAQVTSMSELALYGSAKCPPGWIVDGTNGCKDHNECSVDNGGCDPRRKCTNTIGGKTCGNCPTTLDNDGPEGCKNKGRSAALSKLINALPSNAMGQTSTATCDVSGISKLVKRFPPKAVKFKTQVSRTKFKCTWTISGHSYGNGKYVAEASNAYGVGTPDEWPASGAFDHQPGKSSIHTGWHTSGGSNWLTLELPEAIRLDYYTVATRTECCASQNPTKWDLFCLDDPSKKVKIDARGSESLGVGQCKVYPAKTPNGGMLCQKFQWVVTLTSMGELALYGH